MKRVTHICMPNNNQQTPFMPNNNHRICVAKNRHHLPQYRFLLNPPGPLFEVSHNAAGNSYGLYSSHASSLTLCITPHRILLSCNLSFNIPFEISLNSPVNAHGDGAYTPILETSIEPGSQMMVSIVDIWRWQWQWRRHWR